LKWQFEGSSPKLDLLEITTATTNKLENYIREEY
jgi:hypothetical protein